MFINVTTRTKKSEIVYLPTLISNALNFQRTRLNKKKPKAIRATEQAQKKEGGEDE